MGLALRRLAVLVTASSVLIVVFVECSVPEYGFRDEASSSSSSSGEAGIDGSPSDGSSSSGDVNNVADTNASDAPTTDTGVIVKPGCSGLPPNDFCSDFDTGNLPGIWNGQGATTNGTYAIDTNASTSPQRSAVFTTNALGSSGEIGQVYLQKNFPQTTFKTIRVEFDVRIDQICGASVVAVIALRNPPVRYDLQYAVTMPGSRINESNYAVNDAGAFYKQLTATSGPTLGVWTHIVISAHIPAPSTISIEQDGVVVLSPSAITPTALDGASTLGVGVAYVAAPTAACSIHIDNVTIGNAN